MPRHPATSSIVTVPLKAYQDVPVEPLAGKIVLDTNNYYWERDGHIAALDEKRATDDRSAAGAPADLEGREGLQPHRLQRDPHRRRARRHARAPRARDR